MDEEATGAVSKMEVTGVTSVIAGVEEGDAGGNAVATALQGTDFAGGEGSGI